MTPFRRVSEAPLARRRGRGVGSPETRSENDMSADPGTPNLGEVRAAHRLDEAALDRWLAANVEGYRGPLSVSQFKGGASNPTYLLIAAEARYVLRKKPPGLLRAPTRWTASTG